MSQKRVKENKRVMNRQERRILKDLIKKVKGMKFGGRVKIAWAIVRGK